MTNKIQKIRFGIIGTNFISDWVIKGAKEDKRFELTAVYSRTKEKAEQFAQRHGIPHIFSSIEEMAQSDLIDAVYIASPNSLHCKYSMMFMNCGKNVLCEKPLASNYSEVKSMVECAKNNNVVLMEAMKPTLTPNFKAVINSMNNIGTIRNYFSCYCQYSSRYDKLKEGIVLNAFKPELSNGALMDIGVYTVYPMVVLFGEPVSIKASGIKLHTGVDGCGSVVFEYPGMMAQIVYSKIADSSLPTEIQGEKGRIELDRINIISKAELNKKDNIPVVLTQNEVHDQYFYEVEEFLNLIDIKNKYLAEGKSINDHSIIESKINSLNNSLICIKVLDEIRKQIGVVYPSDC
ncbi:MAG: Gfo/Idh/MocA family oxidoreductase [Bacteroidales bacterium]|nr:Gfo/Idh/MocA family oxidoreductase [Bacteroidales bacterium]